MASEGRGESFAYAAGAVLSFAVLGLAIVLLRQGGAAWAGAFSCSRRIAVAGFALLVFAVALNLSGLFEVGSITAGESLTQQERASPAPSSPACWRWRWPRPAPRPSWRRRWVLR